MFFEGDLQSGIAVALQESKSVACFVRGDDDQSSRWEDEYLKDDQIARALALKAVTLRINAQSAEAGFLAAYYPLPVVPAFILIQNGQLVLDLRSGEAKDSFKAAILKTLVSKPSQNAPSPAAITTNGTSSSDPETTLQQSTSVTPANAPSSSDTPSSAIQSSETVGPSAFGPAGTSSITSTPSPSSSSTQPSQTVQNLLADRRRRLEIDKREKEEKDKAERKAKAEARKTSVTADPNSAKAKQATYAEQQRKRQQEAKVERERILKQIEHDKIERKEKEELRKALAKAEAEAEGSGGSDGAGGLVDQQLSSEMSKGTKAAGVSECPIQVRMFDGSTLRNRFSPEQTVRSEVRPWVDKQRSDGDSPYTFKQILAPLPNRSLSISDEEESLRSLGLTPSATLVMIPVKGYTAAYDNQGILSKGASAGYSIVSTGAGLVTGAIGTFLGVGQATTPEGENVVQESTSPPAPEPGARGTASGINIRTLQDQQGNRDEHQLYNGNQLNFEPRRDSDDKDD